MKRYILLVILAICEITLLAQPQYGTTRIYSNQREVCPGENYSYGSYVSHGNNYQLQWEVVNGVFDDGKTYAYDWIAPVVIWNDNATVGKLILRVASYEGYIYNGDNRPYIIEQRILSVKDLTPSIAKINKSDYIPFGVQEISITLSKITYPGTNIEVTQYEWTLPQGWTSAGKKGTFTAGNSITIKTDNFTEGSIIVKAKGKCGNASTSKSLTINYKRSFNFTTYPPFIPYGSLSIYDFAVRAVNLQGVQYEWKVPVGWRINGGNNTHIGTSPHVQIQVVNPNSNGVVKVRLRLGNELSDWYICPCNGVQTFDGSIKNIDLNDERLYAWSDIYVENVNIKNGSNVILNGYNSVRIVPGFTAELGSTLRIYNGTTKMATQTVIGGKIIQGSDMVLDKCSIKLSQNIPNPANSMTTISCIIPEVRKTAYIQVYNLMGILVLKIPITSIGQNSIDVNTTELTNGVYMYSLIVDDCLIDTKRMVVAN